MKYLTLTLTAILITTLSFTSCNSSTAEEAPVAEEAPDAEEAPAAEDKEEKSAE